MVAVMTVIGIFAGSVLMWLGGILPFWAHASIGRQSTRPAYRGPMLLHLYSAAAGFDKTLQRGVLVEVGYAVALSLLWLHFGFSSEFLLNAAVIALLLVISLVDLNYRLILNVVTYPTIVFCLLAHVLRGDVLAALLGGGFALGIFGATSLVQPGKLGGGDIKLACLLGVAFGFPGILTVLIIGTVTGGIAGFIVFMRSRALTFAYAPYLCFGAAVSLFVHPLFLG